MRLVFVFFFFSSRRRHTRWTGDWSSDVCSSDLATGCGTPRPAALCPSSLAGMVDEGRELAAERRGVLPAQIDLILRAVQAESHRLIRPAPIKIVFERDGGLLCHPGLLTAICYLHRTRSPAM